MNRILAALAVLLWATPALAGTVNFSPPFGYWRLPVEEIGKAPENFDGLAFKPETDTPATVFVALDKARANHVHVFLSLVNFGDLQEDPPGNFSLARWQARYNAWCPQHRCIDLDPYVRDGTLIGLHIFEYSKPNFPRRLTPDLDQIHQVALYVKTLWPHVPTIVDSSKPCVYLGRDWHNAVDIVLLTVFTNPLGNFVRGDALIDRNVACAKQAGLRFFLGPNPFGGAQQNLPDGSLENFRHYTELSIRYPGSLGTAIWRWWPADADRQGNGLQSFANFWSETVNPGVGAAMQEIKACAAHPGDAACPHAAD